jgi:hypothetical protein
MTNRITLALTGLLAATALAAPAQASSILFQFDQSLSSVSVTENGRACLPFSGCALSATLLPLGDLTIAEGGSASFDFASFNVSRGFGGDDNARVEAVLAFTNPLAGPAGTGGTASYLRLGGFFTPGVVAGSLTWDNPVQQLTAADGSVFTVKFGNLSGVTFGSNAVSPVTITVNSVVPEPATWALMIAGFGMVGYAMRRRQNVVVRYA